MVNLLPISFILEYVLHLHQLYADLNIAISGVSYFSGGGYKLGQTEIDHEFVPGAASNRVKDKKLDVVLKLWKNGFSINDGPLREYHGEENTEFLQSIRKGEVPMVCQCSFVS